MKHAYLHPKFYECKTCGNVIEMVEDSNLVPSCCGGLMERLIPGSIEASVEKHVPVIESEHCKIRVYVGSEEHPMTKEHHISWIELVSDRGIQRKKIYPGHKPEACFSIEKGEQIIATYAYCNLHGLWISICQQ